ncbi:MAG TPA: hypothetical protein EYO59_03915 [Chromatiaceae bacterium]|nr:hypothetical protein [Chromatiaceae bacterium]
MDAVSSSHENITDYGPLQTNEINVPRLARGIMTDTITETHSGALASVTTASNGTIPEPENPLAALYPFNTVEESDSGHVKEVDDTPGAERIKETHRTGTFYEIHPDGTKVTKVVGDQYSITYGKMGTKINGRSVVHVGGESDFFCERDIKVHGMKNIEISGDEKVRINSTGGHLEIVSAGGNVVVVSQDGSVQVGAQGDINLVSGGNITLKDGSAAAPNVARLNRDTIPVHKAGIDIVGGSVPLSHEALILAEGAASDPIQVATPGGAGVPEPPPTASGEVDIIFQTPEDYRAFVASINALKSRVAAQDLELDELRTLIERRGSPGGISGI